MTAGDMVGLSLEALRAHRLRYGLSALAIAVGIAAVVLMSSIGEGTRRFILNQVSQFGTTIIGINPGKVSTHGIPGMAGGSARLLTIDDARALKRVPGVDEVVALTFGTALVEWQNRGRRTFVYGVTAGAPKAWNMPIAQGQFIPDMDWESGSAVTVLGPKLKRELFGEAPALGEIVRIGLARYRVIGVMEPKGTYLGFDLDDCAYIPVASAMKLFNRPELAEIDLLAHSTEVVDVVVERVRATLIDRHRGEEDFTVVTQKDAIKMVDNIMAVVTTTVTAIAAISLLVGAIGILTILWIVVRERTPEIGLVKALGADRRTILGWYLCEAGLTALIGGGAGLLVGIGGASLLSRLVPGLSSFTSPAMVAMALGVSLAVGLVAGVVPALRAAQLDPVEALHAE